jgi:hypothetical protein
MREAEGRNPTRENPHESERQARDQDVVPEKENA